jgi:hypothetical protein
LVAAVREAVEEVDKENVSLGVIAGSLGKSLDVVRCKIKRLGLNDDDQMKKILGSSSSVTCCACFV